MVLSYINPYLISTCHAFFVSGPSIWNKLLLDDLCIVLAGDAACTLHNNLNIVLLSRDFSYLEGTLQVCKRSK